MTQPASNRPRRPPGRRTAKPNPAGDPIEEPPETDPWGDIDGAWSAAGLTGGEAAESAAEGDNGEEEPDLTIPHVTAVLVAHDGETWLPATLAALAGQTRKPDRRVAVDTGSADATPTLLLKAYGVTKVVTTARTTGFGAAVALGVDHATGGDRVAAHSKDRPAWIWILHDDLAPEPTALEALLRFAATAPSATILGPKVLDWADPRLLVEIGFRCDGAGRRETGLERGEFDGGQHDAPADVLAVGSAGMLVRREVWDALGGFDPELPLLRDDLDLCWRAGLAGERVCVVPTSVVRHARAVTTGARTASAITDSPARVDRRNAVYVVQANAGLPGFLLGIPRLAIGALVRALVFLLTRRPTPARDELSAFRIVVAAPRRMSAARRRRAATRRLSTADLRPLMAGRSHRLREYAQGAADLLANAVGANPSEPGTVVGVGIGGGDGGRPGGRRSTIETGPSEDGDELPVDDTPILRRLLTRPGLLLVLALGLLAVIACRHLLGAGSLHGGRLLRAPSGAIDVWRSYADGWQAVGSGSPTPAPPWSPVFALISTLLLGKPWLAVDLLTVGLVPLAGFAAWRASVRLIPDVRIRLWAACTYALLPAVTGAVAGARFDVGAVVILAPGLVRALMRLLSVDATQLTWRRGWSTGLLLAVAGSFWPPLVSLAAAGLVAGLGIRLAFRMGASQAGAVGRPRSGRSAGRRRSRLALSVIVLGVPVGLAVPWWPAVLADPRLLVVGLGRASGLTDVPANQAPKAVDVLLADPLGPGTPWRWILAPVVLAGLVALLRAERRRAMAAWGLVLLGIGGALAASRLSLGRGVDGPLVGWGGAALAVGSIGLLAAAAIAAREAKTRLAALPFGWRQPSAAVLAAVVAAVPLVAAAAWVHRGADQPVIRSSATLLPAFVEGDGTANPGQRVLLLRQGSTGGPVTWALTRLGGPRLGDEDARPTPTAMHLLETVIADLASPRGTDAGEVLSTFGVRYIAVPSPGEQGLLDALDVQPVLSRVAYEGAVRLWRLVIPTNRLTVLAPPLAAAALSAAPSSAGSGRGPTRRALRETPPTGLDTGVEGASGVIAPGPPGRLVVLAEPAGYHWVATLNGRRLVASTAWNWAQAYRLPPSGGRLVITHAPGVRRLALAIQGLVLLLALVFAAPELGREDDPPRRLETGVDPS